MAARAMRRTAWSAASKMERVTRLRKENGSDSICVDGADCRVGPPLHDDRDHAGYVVQVAPRLEKYVTSAVKLAAEERNELGAGSPVAKLLEADDSQEIAVFSAIWIDAPMRRYVQALQDIEAFGEAAASRSPSVSVRLPRAEDFAQMRLADGGCWGMRDCQIRRLHREAGGAGHPAIPDRDQLGRAERSLGCRFTDAAARARYVNGYLEGGNSGSLFTATSARPRFVAEQFGTMIDPMPELVTYMPDVRRYLLEFPKASLAGSSSFLYWQETEFGLRPTIRIGHVVIREGPDDTVVASKMLYASHYFWTGLELRVLLPDAPRGRGFWFVNINRSQSDGLDGFTGRLIRGRVRSEVRNGAMAALQTTKRYQSVRP